MRTLERPTQIQVFQYLDELWQTGESVMGMPAHLVAQFHLDYREAENLMDRWMMNFTERP